MAITEPDAKPGRARRLLWFALLWLGGVAGVTVFAYSIRFVAELAGLSAR